jgi:hypothetical protein
MEEETVQHTVTQVEKQTPNYGEGELETQDEFKEEIYGRNRRRQWQQIMIGTSRDIEIRAEKKKAWNQWSTDKKNMWKTKNKYRYAKK